MKKLQNCYKKLKQENIDASRSLKTKNSAMIERMMQFISSKNISLFELEVIKKDMIGLAKEAETEGLSLKDKLGMSEQEFANSITAETEGRGWLEHGMMIGCMTLLVAAIVYLIDWWFYGFPKEYVITGSYVFFVLVIVFFEEFLERVVLKRFLYSKSKKTVTALVYASEILVLWMWFMRPDDGLILLKGNGLMIGIVLAVLTAISYAGNRMYWNSQARKYNWK